MQRRDGTSDEKQDAGRDGDLTHSAVIDVPTLDDRPGLVDAAEIRKRLEAVQTSIQKSVLALLAIVAFWLAIENSYHRFTTRFAGNARSSRARRPPLDDSRSSILFRSLVCRLATGDFRTGKVKTGNQQAKALAFRPKE